MAKIIPVRPLSNDQHDTFIIAGSEQYKDEVVNAVSDLRKVSLKEEHIAEHYRILRPILLSMKLFGLYFEPEKRKDKKNSLSLGKAYCFIVTLLIGFNVCRLFTMFNQSDGFNPLTFGKINVMIWMTACFCLAVSCFHASRSYSCIPQFFIEWSRLHYGEGYLDMNKVKRRVVVYTIAAWVVVILNMLYTLYGIFTTHYFDALITPISPDSPCFLTAKIVMIPMKFYMSCAWALPIALGCIICSTVYDEFLEFNTQLSNKIKDNRLNGQYETMRLRHQAICTLAEHADNILSFQYAVLFVSNLGLSCLVLYIIINYSVATSDPMSLSMYIYWLVGSLTIMAVVSIGGGLVNHEAHASLNTVHNIDTSALSAKEALQINMFILKLNGPPIGLTALDMFVIDKPTVLTVAGMLVTYFVLLIQFKPPSTGTDGSMTSCNCTSLIGNQ